MAWEYNPFHNFRFPLDTDINGKHIGEQGFDKDNIKYNAGTVQDLDTSLLNFNLNYPVDITCQPSYDGSVNLILNDNHNIPRLINSRFSVLPKNKYEIVDRVGNNDTNLYDDTQFDQDTSLYKTINYIPKIKFNGVFSGGKLLVGNYHLYIKYADADGNETDFVAESGLISVFIGNDADPSSIQGGIKDMQSNKSINITVTNVDPAYDYIKVYYTRETSDLLQNSVTSAFKIEQDFICQNQSCRIIINGDEKKTEIPISEINNQYFIADAVQAQAQAQNMLFLGNIHKPVIDYTDLQDISLRIQPSLSQIKESKLIGSVDTEYVDNSFISNNYGYYNTLNIYNYVGYWPQEIYRFGVVYILKDYTLSPVFNIRGKLNLNQTVDTFTSIWNDRDDHSKGRKYLEIRETDFSIYDDTNTITTDNAKGVCYIDSINGKNEFDVLGIQMNIPKECLEYMQSLDIKGLFFVRQKRIPTILAQCLTLPMDSISNLPAIKGGTKGWFIEGIVDENGYLTQEYNERKKQLEIKNNNSFAGICPEYDVRYPYFNNLFTGSSFILQKYSQGDFMDSNYNNRRILYKFNNRDNVNNNNCHIAALEDNMPLVMINDYKFRGRAGEAEEAYKFRYAGNDTKTSDNYNVVRGIFGPYLAITSTTLENSCIYNICIPGYQQSKKLDYFEQRYNSNDAYYPISDRVSIQDIYNECNMSIGYMKAKDTTKPIQLYNITCYRGDCYICTFTHRLNRNFSDPTSPTNSEIVDTNTWRDNVKYVNGILKSDNLQKLNRGDVNAIEIGTWITLKVLSTYNLNIRSQDQSHADEVALMGSPRTFYPLTYCNPDGNFKMPESFSINDGFGKSTGSKVYFTYPNVPYIKNRFDNRIAYSNIAVNDAFKNGYRTFNFTNYRDYPRIYGGLMKLIELQGNLVAVWEHGVGIIPVNERALAGEGAGGEVFINTSNVLPENPKILSDKFGTQWPESVIKTPYYLYGVDTVDKKIWRTNGSNFEIISDFRVQKFLNNNISLTERELEPIIGIRNVKTHYNAFKNDVMFTFYDNVYGFEEKVWNLCYNEIMEKFVTFYSWIPSYSESIDNMYFSFDRNTSKWISKLAVSSKNSTSADGIVLDNNIIDDNKFTANCSLTNRPLPEMNNILITYDFSLERDVFRNDQYFKLENGVLTLDNTKDIDSWIKSWKYPVVLLNIQCNVSAQYTANDIPIDVDEYIQGFKKYFSLNLSNYQSVVAITTKDILNNMALTPETKEMPNLTTDFWKHGQAGIIDIKDQIKPCFWYGKQHPFEYEFVVVDNPTVHKIFDNLEITGNNAQPESFHYEIIGDSFDFNEDKSNMYVRQEATKDLYQYNGSDILYNRDFLDIQTKQLKKSHTMPLYYSRVDTYNEVEDYYKSFSSPNKDYSNLSGTEVVYDKTLGQFSLWEHSKAVNNTNNRGNTRYIEDRWYVQINPIIIVEKNEDPWPEYNNKSLVPLTVGNSAIPEDIKNLSITDDDIPQDLKEVGYKANSECIDITNWGVYPVRQQDGQIVYADANSRKEVRVKDKFIKIRIRYTGNELAIIHSLRTLYTISYS